MTRIRALLLMISVAPAGGCATLRGGGAAPCAPVGATMVTAATDISAMAGDFVITLVAENGPRRGQTVAGYLRLRVPPAGTPGPTAGARTAFIGTTDVALEQVGARRLGDTGSQDARAPGVAIYEQRTPTSATLTARVGSHTTAAPTPGLVAIEGAHTALFIRRVESRGFAGGWTSGDGTPTGEVRGHFCAEKL